MLSYQHIYHAGNRADIHKHLLLNCLIQSLHKKDKPLTLVDTHAGEGVYRLDREEALKNTEADSGARQLLSQADSADFNEPLGFMGKYLANNEYPGSPEWLFQSLRENDRLVLFELHPQAVAALKRRYRDSRVSMHQRDVLEGLPAISPLEPRRGLILVDPSWELKSDYQDIPVMLQKVLKKWSVPVVALWYPLLASDAHQDMLKQCRKKLEYEMLVSEWEYAPKPASHGMYGSGVLLINPPWQIETCIESLHGLLAACYANSSFRCHNNKA